MNYALAEEPLFDTPIALVEYDEISYAHYEYRAGRWWKCEEPTCDGIHHYYTPSQKP